MFTQDPILTQAIEKQFKARLQKEAETSRLLRKLAAQDTQIVVEPRKRFHWSLKGVRQIGAWLAHALKEHDHLPHAVKG
jgi:hypothetical protein